MLARQCALVTLLVRMIFLVSRGKKNTENIFVFFHDSYAAVVRTFFFNPALLAAVFPRKGGLSW